MEARRDLDAKLAQPLGSEDEPMIPPVSDIEEAQRERDLMLAAGFGAA